MILTPELLQVTLHRTRKTRSGTTSVYFGLRIQSSDARTIFIINDPSLARKPRAERAQLLLRQHPSQAYNCACAWLIMSASERACLVFGLLRDAAAGSSWNRFR